jgi:FkbM family methyltransferase
MWVDFDLSEMIRGRALHDWLAKPSALKRRSLRHHFRRAWNRVLPACPLPLRLMPGIWWIARNDAVSDELWEGVFEPNERAFLERALAPGMIVLDVGAHAGLYSLIASKRVGPSGRVIAFEPSPRERERLRQHLRLNRCRNVTVEPVAVGDGAGEGELFVFAGRTTGCNSFHLASGQGATPVRVPIRSLDDYLDETSLPRADFVKMDIEGGELAALRGAERLFRVMRPTLVCEIHDRRTAPWGYRARDIIDLVERWEYQWFLPEDEGRLSPIGTDQQTFFGNGIAIPAERAASVHA